jgi:hypothetical protein
MRRCCVNLPEGRPRRPDEGGVDDGTEEVGAEERSRTASPLMSRLNEAVSGPLTADD